MLSKINTTCTAFFYSTINSVVLQFDIFVELHDFKVVHILIIIANSMGIIILKCGTYACIKRIM